MDLPTDLSSRLWMLIIIIIFMWILISLVFILINKCISKAGKLRIAELQRMSGFSTKSNQYQGGEYVSEIPPLPPRTQFLLTEAQSYENLDAADDQTDRTDQTDQTDQIVHEQDVPDYEQVDQDVPDYEQDVPHYEQDVPDYEQVDQDVPDCEQDVPDYEQVDQDVPDCEQDVPEYEQDVSDYEQVDQDVPDYEQDVADYEQDVADYEQDKQSDSLKAVGEDEPLPLIPRYPDPDPAADSFSEEDYDDIGGEDETEGEEDYDDVA